MRAKYFLLCVILISFFSCKECDCENDCDKPEPEVVILTPENTITENDLHYAYLDLQSFKLKKHIASLKDSLTLNGINEQILISKIKVSNNRLNDIINQLKEFTEKGGRRPCVICPDGEHFCCPSEILKYFSLKGGLENISIKGLDKDNNIINDIINTKDKLTVDNKSIFPVNLTSAVKELNIEMLDENGEEISFKLNLNNP